MCLLRVQTARQVPPEPLEPLAQPDHAALRALKASREFKASRVKLAPPDQKALPALPALRDPRALALRVLKAFKDQLVQPDQSASPA